MPWLKINKETESCEIEEEVEMNMTRNFEKLLTDHPDMCCEVEPKDYPPYLDYEEAKCIRWGRETNPMNYCYYSEPIKEETR